MPKKLNSAGQMQNYVPKGNGDASGEYGDNASGSNRNWKNPESSDKPNTPKTQDIAISVDNKKEYNDFKNYISEKYKDDEFGENITYHFESGNEMGKSVVNHAISKGAQISISDTGFSYCDDNGVSFVKQRLTKEENKYSHKVRGETFYHEFWHSIDRLSSADLIDDEDRKYVKDNIKEVGFLKVIYANRNLSSVSTGKKLSNGKTLYETLKDECHKIALNRSKQKGTTWDIIQRDYYSEKDKKINEKHAELEQKRSLQENLRNKLKEQAKETAEANGKLIWWDYYAQLIENNTEYKNLSKEIDDLEMSRLEVEADMGKSWMSISDIYGMYNKVGGGFCGGHESSYTKTRGKEVIAREFIAEFGSAMSRNDEYAKKEIELFNKYFPETSKMCNELMNMILKNIK